MRTRLLTPDEAHRAHAVVAAAGRALAESGFRNWDPPPALEKFRADAAQNGLFLVENEAGAVATYGAVERMPKPYPESIFRNSERALYVNRLAVLPIYWRGGVGAACMRAVEELARGRGIAVVRLDTYRPNVPIRRFYERLGYVARGDWDGWEVPLTCMEKRL
jgi:GNAT superfamily N-acetyltransferase